VAINYLTQEAREISDGMYPSRADTCNCQQSAWEIPGSRDDALRRSFGSMCMFLLAPPRLLLRSSGIL